MSKSNWKGRERQIAKFFGTRRTPLSGGNSGHTRSDTLHEHLFIEQKQRKKHSAVTLWDETKEMADKENKIPIVTLSEKGRPGFWLLIKSTDFDAIANQRECHKKEGV